MMSHGDALTILIKKGNYKLHNEHSDTYIIYKDKREYFKFKNLDTVYYIPFSYDTAKVQDIEKKDGPFKVYNTDCKSITIRTATSALTFYYSPQLRLDPEYDKENTNSKYNVYSQETQGSVYLYAKIVYPFATATDSCIKVESKPLDDLVFALPSLPVKELIPAQLISAPKFHAGDKAWLHYLESTLDAKLALKYVKLPKGQREASEKVMVRFKVEADGSVSHPEVVNAKEVHPQLAKEALRVITESPRWEPASFFGEKVVLYTQQPIIFKVQAE
jgi:hypothetical protein